MKAKAPWVVALVVVSGVSIAIVFLWTGERQRVSIDEPPDLSAATGEARSDEGVTSAGATDASSEAIIEDQARDVAASVSGEEQQQEAEEALPELPPTMTQALQDLELLPPIPEFAQTVRDFASQLDDEPWSEAIEAHIFGQISQATGLGASDIQVDCRTTMCRVRLSNPVSTLSPRYRSLNELVDTFGLETLWLWAAPDSNGNPVNLSTLGEADRLRRNPKRDSPRRRRSGIGRRTTSDSWAFERGWASEAFRCGSFAAEHYGDGNSPSSTTKGQ